MNLFLQVIANYFGTDKKYVPVKGVHISWPGGRTGPPKDSPDCGFRGELCVYLGTTKQALQVISMYYFSQCKKVYLFILNSKTFFFKCYSPAVRQTVIPTPEKNIETYSTLLFNTETKLKKKIQIILSYKRVKFTTLLFSNSISSRGHQTPIFTPSHSSLPSHTAFSYPILVLWHCPILSL